MDGGNQNVAAHGLPEDLGATLQGTLGLPCSLAAAALPSILAATSSSFSGASLPYLAWPPHQPTDNVPFFDAASYKNVNLDVQPSCLPNGTDLPLGDITTLRFFFNMGVNHARAVLLSHHVQAALNNFQAPQTNGSHISSLTTNSATNSQNPIGISTNALRNEQFQIISQMRAQQQAQQFLASQKTVAEKIREVQQQQLSKPSNATLSMKSQQQQSTLSSPFVSTPTATPLETLLLQSALLNNANGNRSLNLNELALRHQLINASAQNDFNSLQTSLIQQNHELIKPIAVNTNDVSQMNAAQTNGSNSPRTRIPVDPAPRSESALERTIRLVQQDLQNSAATQQLSDLQQQALLTLRSQTVDGAALQAAQLAAAVAAGQQSRDAAHAQQMTALLSAAAARQSTSPMAQPVPIRPTPKHQPTTIEDMPPSHSIFAASEMHYNEAFKKGQNPTQKSTDVRSPAMMSPNEQPNTNSRSASSEQKSEDQEECRSTVLHPQAMINLLNGYLSDLKSKLHHQGVAVQLNQSLQPIDFSARPVDPIFRKAREQLENSREYRDTSPPTKHISIDRTQIPSFSLKEAEVVRQASERLQQSSALRSKVGSDPCVSPSSSVGQKRSSTPSKASSASSSPGKGDQSVGSPSRPKGFTVDNADSVKSQSNSVESNMKSADDYDNDYSPDEKRLRIVSTEEE